MRLTMILSAVALVVLHVGAVTAIAGEGDSKLQGIWFGDGVHPMSRNVLIVDGDQFTILSPLGAFVSKYSSRQLKPLNEIDIDRFDGDRQMGVFEATETQLFLQLGEPNGSRPTLKDVRLPDGTGHWHTKFRRRPTSEGLEVLTSHMSKLLASGG